jgi:hypothetical protein
MTKTVLLFITSVICIVSSIGWIKSAVALSRLKSSEASRFQAEQEAEELRQDYLNASPALQKANTDFATGAITNDIATGIMSNINEAIDAAYYGNPTNALAQIRLSKLELDNIVILFSPHGQP